MKIWYVTENIFDYEDVIQDIKFFSTQEAAESLCSKLESQRKKMWTISHEANREKYEREEIARKALDEVGISWTNTALRYSSNWKNEEYIPCYEIKSIEVAE